MVKFLRSGLKIGLLAGALYITNDIGLWKESKVTQQLYKDIYLTVAPMVEENIPIEVPEFLKAADIRRSVTDGWNHGVLTVFSFLAQTPNYLCSSVSSSANYIYSQFK